MQTLYHVQSDTFDAATEAYHFSLDEHGFPTRELTEVFCGLEAKKLLRVFFLHFADISNVMKPWKLCRYWAEQALEEMFLQGDREKALGIPVQALNDRDTVNVPQAQLRFIEFFIAPMVGIAVQWFPPLAICEE